MMKKSALLGVLLLTSVFGCSVANYVVPAYSTLTFDVSNKTNPDLNGRPSPVVVYVYELTSNTLFENQDFFSLYENAETVLGPDLVSKKEFTFSPGAVEKYEVSMSPDVEFVGVVAAFRDIENANWRKIMPIDKTGYKKHNIIIGQLSVALK